jgi:hypothetical protein
MDLRSENEMKKQPAGGPLKTGHSGRDPTGQRATATTMRIARALDGGEIGGHVDFRGVSAS